MLKDNLSIREMVDMIEAGVIPRQSIVLNDVNFCEIVAVLVRLHEPTQQRNGEIRKSGPVNPRSIILDKPWVRG